MDKKNKNTKAPDNTRKTTRSGSLKSSVSSVVAENRAEAPLARRQNTGDKKTTSTPEKPAASKSKPAATPEASKLEASKPEASTSEASKPETTQGESSIKNNNIRAMEITALLNKQMEEFRNIMISTHKQMVLRMEKKKKSLPIPLRIQPTNKTLKDYREENSYHGPAWNDGSKDIESKDKRDFSRRGSTKQNSYNKNKRKKNNHSSGTDVCTKQNYYKESRTSSNNLIPKTALLMQDGSEYEKYVPEAKINNLHSQINIIHLQLAKGMGFNIEDRPLTFTTAADKVLIPQVKEECKIKVKLVEECTGKIKWYDFNTRCRLDEAMPRTIIFDRFIQDDGERPGLPDIDSSGECEETQKEENSIGLHYFTKKNIFIREVRTIYIFN
ncbi:hypothetical protein H8356DRAFT_1351057 [Neocallimastix lanati (nom. inval.)]|nr:hypothetical protein H8356DRAFT_1351057 [Neocallimastix sp. JGI-2020a]